jgi:catalase
MNKDTPNTLNNGYPAQANQTTGKGFFTAPGRTVSGNLVRDRSATFDDHWTQPRLFYNSLTPVEQQFVINAIRFETSNLKSRAIKERVLAQLNKISNDVAIRVAAALGLPAPQPDTKYYHDNTTAGISIFNTTLPTIATLKVGVLVSTQSAASVEQAAMLKQLFNKDKVTAIVVGESLADGIDATYSLADATAYDGIIVTAGAEGIFGSDGTTSTLYPIGRPSQILVDGYRWGKPLGAVGSASDALLKTGIPSTPGVFAESDPKAVAGLFKQGLATFRFVDRFPVDK